MPKHDYASWKSIALNRDSVCAECGVTMPKGAKALWSRNLSLVACLSHGDRSNPVVAKNATTESKVAPMEPGLNGKQVTDKGLAFVAEKMKDPEVTKEVKAINTKMNLEDLEDLVIPTVTGVAGGEARRFADKNQAKTDAKREAGKEKMGEVPIVGKALASVFDLIVKDSDIESKNAHAWKHGASGEEGVGKRLNELAEKYGFLVLHDRKQGKGKSANIDHIVITSKAVYIIDAKNYTGMVEVETNGWINGNKPVKLKVNGRSQMKLVDGMHKQVVIVEEVLKNAGTIMPVIGMLAFYLADWPLFKTPTEIQGVLLNGKGIEPIISQPGSFAELARKEAWVAIAEALPEVK